MLERLRELASLTVDVQILDEECDVYTKKVEEGIADQEIRATLPRDVADGHHCRPERVVAA